MATIYFEIPPPAYWEDFERLTAEIGKKLWDDDYVTRNGRSGQAQDGVDVFGVYRKTGERIGVQCKKRTALSGSRDAPSSDITKSEIGRMVTAAQAFKPSLTTFIIATTARRDAKLQKQLRELNASGGHPFLVELWFWEDYVEQLNRHPNLMHIFYDAVLKARDEYSPETHYLRLLASAFDRPAMRTAFHLENRIVDFIDAIQDTQEAISTGTWKDRGGRVIDASRLPETKWPELRQVATLLQEIRELSTEALAKKEIVQHPAVIEVKSRKLQSQINGLRKQAVDRLNELLGRHGIEGVNWRDR